VSICWNAVSTLFDSSAEVSIKDRLRFSTHSKSTNYIIMYVTHFLICKILISTQQQSLNNQTKILNQNIWALAGADKSEEYIKSTVLCPENYEAI